MNKEVEPRIGIPGEALTDSVWRGVVRTYFETTGNGYVPDQKRLETRYFASIALEGHGEFRLGSRFSVHSKLRIESGVVDDEDILYFDFDPNVDTRGLDPETKLGKEIVETTQVFRSVVDQYLQAEAIQSRPIAI